MTSGPGLLKKGPLRKEPPNTGTPITSTPKTGTQKSKTWSFKTNAPYSFSGVARNDSSEAAPPVK